MSETSQSVEHTNADVTIIDKSNFSVYEYDGYVSSIVDDVDLLNRIISGKSSLIVPKFSPEDEEKFRGYEAQMQLENSGASAPESHESDTEAPSVVAHKSARLGENVYVLAHKYEKADTVLDWEQNPNMQNKNNRRAVVSLENGNALYILNNTIYDFASDNVINFQDDEDLPVAQIGQNWNILDEQGYATNSPVKEASVYWKIAHIDDESDKSLLSGSEINDVDIFNKHDRKSLKRDVEPDAQTVSSTDLVPYVPDAEPKSADQDAKPERLKTGWASLGAYVTRAATSVKETKVGRKISEFYHEDGKTGRRKAATLVLGALALGGIVGGIDLLASSGVHHHAMDAHNLKHPSVVGNGSGLTPVSHHNAAHATHNVKQHPAVVGNGSGLTPVHSSQAHASAANIHHHASKITETSSEHTVKGEFVSEDITGHLNSQHNSIYATTEAALPKYGIAATNHNVSAVTNWIMQNQHVNPNLATDMPVGYAVHFPSMDILRHLTEEKIV